MTLSFRNNRQGAIRDRHPGRAFLISASSTEGGPPRAMAQGRRNGAYRRFALSPKSRSRPRAPHLVRSGPSLPLWECLADASCAMHQGVHNETFPTDPRTRYLPPHEHPRSQAGAANPAPTKASSTSNEGFSSIVQPKTFPPRQSGDFQARATERTQFHPGAPYLRLPRKPKPPRRGRDEEPLPHRPVFRDVRRPAPAWQQRWPQGREGFPRTIRN
jgi:hypothetical protein